MKYSLLIIVIVALLTTSCSFDKKESLSGNWMLVKLSNPNLNTAFNMDKEISDYYQDSQNALSYICFNKDNTFACSLGAVYFTGTWNYDRKANTITVVTNNNSDAVFTFKQDILKKKLALTLKKPGFTRYLGSDSVYRAEVFDTQNTTFKLEKDAFKYDDESRDIFSIKNNEWRIRPEQPETPEQLRLRVKAHIHFLIIYLDNAIKRDAVAINLGPLITPIHFANNGIALKAKSEVPAEWNGFFHDEVQASEAHDMLRSAFREDIKIKPDTKNWLELDMDLLEQIYRKL